MDGMGILAWIGAIFLVAAGIAGYLCTRGRKGMGRRGIGTRGAGRLPGEHGTDRLEQGGYGAGRAQGSRSADRGGPRGQDADGQELRGQGIGRHGRESRGADGQESGSQRAWRGAAEPNGRRGPGEQKNAKSRNTPPADSRYGQLLEECADVYNRCQLLEPQKNEGYRQAFAGEGGILDCMQHYNSTVRDEMESAESVSELKGLLVGNNLRFLEHALGKIPAGGTGGKPVAGREEYLTLLERRLGIEAEPDSSKRIAKLTRALESDRKVLKAEQDRKEKREQYEGMEKVLKGGKVSGLLSFLNNPAPGCTMEEYERAGRELAGIFAGLLGDDGDLGFE